MTQAEIMKPFSNAGETFSDLMVFLIQVQRMENNVRDGCPVPSERMAAEVQRSQFRMAKMEAQVIDKLQELEDIKNKERRVALA